MNILIRNEREEDYRIVEELCREAFWNLYVPGCDEHYLTHIMRSHPDFIKELSLVAELDGKVVGVILYTKSKLISDTGEEKEVATFGPLAVHPDYQRQGIGGKLIHHSFEILKTKGIEGVVIYGSPYNYCKYGFKNGKDYNITDMNSRSPYGLLAYELTKNAFEGQWKYKDSQVYHFDQSKVEEFDKSFPSKEKKYHYSQEIFSISIRSYLK